MKLVCLCCRRWRLLDGNLHLSQTPSTVFWWGRWAHGRCHVMVTWYRYLPLHSPTAWSGTRVWTRSEHCSTLPLTHTTETASQLSFYLSEKHLTIVSQFALPFHLHIAVYVCIAFTQSPNLIFFLSRNSDDDGKAETQSHQSLLQLSQTAPRMERTHFSLSVSIIIYSTCLMELARWNQLGSWPCFLWHVAPCRVRLMQLTWAEVSNEWCHIGSFLS